MWSNLLGSKSKNKKRKMYRLKKALYRLKKAPQGWCTRIDEHFENLEFEKSPREPTMYVKKIGELIMLIVSLYVDDFLVIARGNDLMKEFKQPIELRTKNFKEVLHGEV